MRLRSPGACDDGDHRWYRGHVIYRGADPRPAQILRRIGTGGLVEQAAADVGISRKTIPRWREKLEGFGKAYNRVVELASIGTPESIAEVEAIVASWTPGGLVSEAERAAIAGPTGGEAELELEPETDFEPEPGDPAHGDVPGVEVAMPDAEQPELERVEPDVLSVDGRELVVSPQLGTGRPRRPKPPYTTTRPPTLNEWTATMAALAVDTTQPERIRLGAIASVTATLAGGPGARLNRPVDDVAVAEAARERGRDAGVPANVWQEAKQNFLGPAPPEAEQGGDVVGFERAPPSNG
jgi:hypothetical protein